MSTVLFVVMMVGMSILIPEVSGEVADRYQTLIPAMILQETKTPNLDPKPGQEYVPPRDEQIGDEKLEHKAYGCLQVRQPAVDDINLRFGTNYKSQDCLRNRELSIWMFHRYMDIYATKERLGREPTLEDCARIWNGGPNGYKKESTKKYWGKVRSFMERNQ